MVMLVNIRPAAGQVTFELHPGAPVGIGPAQHPTFGRINFPDLAHLFRGGGRGDGGGFFRRGAEGALQLGHAVVEPLQDFPGFNGHDHAIFAMMPRGGIALDGVFKFFAAGAAGAEALAGGGLVHDA